MARAIREALAGRGPLLMTYRVNAGQLPPGHWTNDPEIGGGRIIGEGCHFVDLMSFLTGDAPIVSVQAACAGRPTGLTEDAAIQLGFADGSVGQILYTARGEPSIGKERLEVHAGGASAVLEDYRSCTIHRGRKVTRVREGGKGHGEEVAALLEAVRRGGPSPIAPATLFGVTRATLEVHRSLAGSAGSR
jgi:predicted dehydrogenase